VLTPQAAPAPVVRQPGAETIRHDKQNSARQDRKQENVIKQQQGEDAGTRHQGGQPAANTGMEKRQGGYRR